MQKCEFCCAVQPHHDDDDGNDSDIDDDDDDDDDGDDDDERCRNVGSIQLCSWGRSLSCIGMTTN